MNCIEDGKYTGDSCFGCKIKAEDCEIRDKVYRNRWIPCSERLPENKVSVLISKDNDTVRVGFCNVNYNEWREDGYILTSPPIAWQPLPQPYEVPK